jgi:hypothetical protein
VQRWEYLDLHIRYEARSLLEIAGHRVEHFYQREEILNQ